MGIETALFATSLAIGAAGVGTSVAGAMSAAEANKNIAGLEGKAEEQRKNAMELDARRKSLEQVRVMQRAHYMAQNNANNQGALQGSGVQGGYGQVAGMGYTNLAGIGQNREIGENLFGINSQISGQKMNLADAQSMSAIGSGLTSLGSMGMGALGNFGKLSQGFPTQSVFGGGGYPGAGKNAFTGWA